MKKTLIIGLDLSFSSTGITISYLEDNVGKSMKFYRVLFDEQSNKTGKRYEPAKVNNVTDIVYIMPTNVPIADLILDKTDINNREQIIATLKGMICSTNIDNIIKQAIEKYEPEEITTVIENYIMPAFSGHNQLKTVSGLIMLQGFVRRDLIKRTLTAGIKLKLLTPTATHIKSFFAKDGNADKLKMLKAFIDHYDGSKLIPGITIVDLPKVDDVIDSFALMMKGYSVIVNKPINQ